ncbi:unnamed protein product [Penicillium olsonii]|uniref:Phosphoglycerate mutase n=1 Tax=Penicillium olsonii TaxID=99116 RepID=A0A9W4HKQ3_PENOL|nr:unnamed protein product [Penicillium olsonii]
MERTLKPFYLIGVIILLYYGCLSTSPKPIRPEMSFRLHIIRHAQGTHNIAHDKTIPDPPLTEEGIQQSEDLCRDFPYKEKVGLVITSPLQRTLQTATVGFEQSIDQKYYSKSSGRGITGGARLSLEPDAQAHSSRPCDTGSDISVLQSRFPGLSWDTLDMDSTFPAKKGIYATDAESLQLRGWRLQRRLEEYFTQLQNSERPDIVVLSHGGWLKYVIGQDVGVKAAKWKTFEVSFDEDSRIVVESSLSEDA